jgi:hypothetical protein
MLTDKKEMQNEINILQYLMAVLEFLSEQLGTGYLSLITLLGIPSAVHVPVPGYMYQQILEYNLVPLHKGSDETCLPVATIVCIPHMHRYLRILATAGAENREFGSVRWYA